MIYDDLMYLCLCFLLLIFESKQSSDFHAAARIFDIIWSPGIQILHQWPRANAKRNFHWKFQPGKRSHRVTSLVSIVSKPELVFFLDDRFEPSGGPGGHKLIDVHDVQQIQLD